MITRFLVLVLVVASVASTAAAQQLELAPQWTGFKDAELRSAADMDLRFEPRTEVSRFGVQFRDLAELYNADQWTTVEPIHSKHPIGDLLVFFYDVPWDATMKQRVREANVVDEEAIFPLPVDHPQNHVEMKGYWLIARRMPQHARIGSDEIGRPLVVEKQPLAFLR